MTGDGTITNKVLLEHMQAMREDIMDRLEKLEGKVDTLDGKVDSLESKVGSLESKVNLVLIQNKNIDECLDAIEIETLPKRVAVLEARAA